MTCDDARAVLSALIDDALPAAERAVCEAHLANCPECARERVRLRATVDLLHALEPVRAPLGFVDRVLAAARTEPPARRAVRGRLRRAWPLGVPLSAVAALLVAVIGLSVYRLTPEQGQAVRRDAARQSEPSEGRARLPGPAATLTAPAAPPLENNPPVPEASRARSTDATEPAPSSPALATEPPGAAAVPDAVAKSAPAPAAPSKPEREGMARREQGASSDTGAPRDRSAELDSRAKQNVGAPETPAPSREDRAPRALERSVGAAAARPVQGRLVVASLASAEREVTDVVSRLNARLEARADDADGLRLTIDVPTGAYPELARALGKIGSLSILAEPGTPTEPTRLVLRITR